VNEAVESKLLDQLSLYTTDEGVNTSTPRNQTLCRSKSKYKERVYKDEAPMQHFNRYDSTKRVLKSIKSFPKIC
jgi:hypothetical protein